MSHVFRITLRAFAGYDLNEEPVYKTHTVIEAVGTEDDAIAAARACKTDASDALIERVAIDGGLSFRPHEIQSFTIGLGD